MKIYQYCLLLKLVFMASVLSINAQVKTTFTPNPNLVKIIDAELLTSCKQYRQLMKHVPDTLLPRTFENGQLKTATSPSWVSGFYPGTLLYLYEYSKDESLLKEASKKLKVLEKEQFNKGTHDLGFMMFCSFGNARRLFNTKKYDQILLNSAKSLSTRYHKEVGLIRSWDHKPQKWKYPVIIDNMVNLELLTWATGISGDSSFYKIAIEHADKTIQHHFRKDFSSYHVVDYDPKTGKVLNKLTEQGFSDESSWARGQAWALYGYTMMFRETRNKRYLEQARQIANFILKHPNLPEDKVPYWDFDASDIPKAKRDVSAGAVICSALLELAGYVNHKEGGNYLRVAEILIRSLSSPVYRSQGDEKQGFLLKHSVGFLPIGSEVDVPLSYADYYYVEAMLRYKNLDRN